MRCRRSLLEVLLIAVLAFVGAIGCERVLSVSTGVRMVEPSELSAMLATPSPPLVVDVRSRAAHAERHVPGAVSAPSDSLDGFLDGAPRSRPIVVVCEHGKASLLAASVALGHGHRGVTSLRGGTNRWADLGLPLERGGPGGGAGGWRREFRTFEQVIAVASGVVIKPLYMLITLGLLVWMRRAKTGETRTIRFALGLFFAGEAFCAVSFYLSPYRPLMPLDLFHGLGMVGMGTLLPLGLYRLVGDRVLHLASPDQKCAFFGLCGRCYKADGASCGMQRVFLFASAALAVVVLIPLSVPVRSLHFTASVFGTEVDYGRAALNQAIEQRLYAVIAAALLAAAVAVIARGADHVSKAAVPFFAGIGFGSFALLRFFLTGAFLDQPVWSDFWEEMTELATIVGLGFGLWVFRAELDLARRPSAVQR